MQEYVIKGYQKGFEHDQARIGREVSRHWIWPYAYSLEDLLQIQAQPDFDPNTRHYCFLGDEMVGFAFSVIKPSVTGRSPEANLDFPRMLPGHEPAAKLLVKKSLETLEKKAVTRVSGRVTTMCPGDVLLAEEMGFTIRDWGYKVYYSYEMDFGRLNIPNDVAQEIHPEAELSECAEIAARWYKRPPEWCRYHLQEWHNAGIITHVGVRSGEKMLAACMAAPNEVRPSTAAIYYIYTPDEDCLIPMLAKVINACVDYGTHNVIADLINEHHQFENIYERLGFKKVAEWARCEKTLA
jgi:hypothetical protein